MPNAVLPQSWNSNLKFIVNVFDDTLKVRLLELLPHNFVVIDRILTLQVGYKWDFLPQIQRVYFNECQYRQLQVSA